MAEGRDHLYTPKRFRSTFKGGEYSGLIFTSVDAEKARGIAETRAMSIPDDKYGNEQWTEEGYVYDLYVNSRNPFDPKDGQAVKKILQSLGSEIPVLSFYGGKGGTVSPEKALELASSKKKLLDADGNPGVFVQSQGGGGL